MGMGNPEKDVLVVQFHGDEGMKQKAMNRGDPQLAVFGAHTPKDSLPPGFSMKPSQSRPGQVVYFDATTGKKYASPELAWGLHLERLTSQPAGCETVFGGVGLGLSSKAPSVCGSVGQGASMPLLQSRHAGAQLPRGSASSEDSCSYGSPAGSAPSYTGGGYSRLGAGEGGLHAPRRSSGNLIKVDEDPSRKSLPSFNHARGNNQAAYLGYIGTSGAADSSEFSQSVRPQDARLEAAQRLSHGAPGRPTAPVRTCGANSQMQAWQQDPFSEWRR